jgi:autotransporter-associated beta strand protein
LNTYTGATIITGIHTLSVSKLDNGGVASNIGASASDAANLVIGQAATLTYTGAGDSTDRLMTLGPTNAWGSVGPTINNNGTGALNFNNTGAVAFTGAVPGGSTQNFTLGGTNTGDNTFAPIITDNGTSPLSFIKAGAGKWILSGANTFTGKTSINGGILSVASLNSVNGGTASSSLGAPITIANGTIAIGSGATAATLLYTGAGETTDRVINLAGTTGGATIDQSGTGLLKFTSAFTATGGGNKTLTLQGFAAGTGEIAGAIVDNTAVTKITSLTKAGTGTWTLSGANSYTGATNVNGGTLLVNGSLASDSAVTVASTATLGGSGTIGGAVTVQAGGKLAPGTSPGQLTVGSLTLAVDSTTQMEIGGATLGTGYDNVTVTTAGGLTYGGLLDIVSYGIYNVAAQSGSYELFTFTGGYAGDFGTVTVNGFALANTAGVWSGTNGGITYTFTDSTGVLQVVPEPAALALLLIGGVGLLRRRRAG